MMYDLHPSRRASQRPDKNRSQRVVAGATAVSDAEISPDLRVAGYTLQTLALIEFAPLVWLAWADGCVSQRERVAIAQVAVREHLRDDTPAGSRLQEWLESCPSDEVFDVSLSTIRERWECLPLDVYDVRQRQFIRDCTTIARGADGAVGDHKIAPEEGRVLARILVALKPSRRASSREP